MGLIHGLIFGALFGFLLKKSRFCATGITRDILLEKNYSNFLYIPAIIFTQAFIYHLMVAYKIIPMSKGDNFSLLAVFIGSILFGFGAVMCNGCITSGLLKCGDGRIIGIIIVIFYIFGAVSAKKGFIAPLHKQVKTIAPVKNHFIANFSSFSVSIFSLIVALILYYFLFKLYKKNKLGFTIPGRYTGLRHLLFEKIWSKELVAVLIGVLMAFGFLSSNLFGRNGGFGITGPLVSWYDYIFNSGKIGWASMLVVGIVLGTFITTILGGEFSIVIPKLKPIIMSTLGAFIMGVGAIWAQGCFVGNVMVGTSQFSLKAWYSLIFIYIGVWLGTKLLLMKKIKK